MATFTFNYGFYDWGGNAGSLPWAMPISFDTTDELTKGDQVTVTDANGADATWEYFGLDANGNPGFVEAGNGGASNATYFLSDTNSAGQPFPTFDPNENFVCFLAGTLISTPGGARAVEELAVGDLVLTAAGRAVPVMFVGRQTVHARFAPAETSRPIRISAGALGENLPERDLWVSPSHAILVDGTLCHARALVNGTTIAQLPAPTEVFTYYSVELEAHEVILAEGAPVESFADHVSRGRFDNAAEFEVLYPQGRVVGEMDLPLAKSARQLPAGARAVIAARAELLAPAARAA